jgi:GNAT superfamily N-acetyltransferase
MIPLQATQVATIAELFADAFAEDPLYAWFFPDERSRRRHLVTLCLLELELERDHVAVTSEHLEGGALWVPPGHNGRFRWAAIGAGIRFAFSTPWPAIWHMVRYHRFSERMRARLLPAPHWYLAVVGVAPEHQGKGFASALIRPVLERATRESLPCYLETQNPANVPIYLRYGFEVAEETTVPGAAVRHFAMVRRP